MANIETLFKEGFLPGPNETEEIFLKRVEKVRVLLEDPTPLAEKLKIPVTSFRKEGSLLICTSDKGLFFWHAAVTLICEVEPFIHIPIVQLPKKRRFFWWIKPEEIIAHEKIHALRSAFQEKQFEEIIAYRTSSLPCRKFLGPLFRNQTESLLFLLFTTGGALGFSIWEIWSFFIPIGTFLLFTLIRLIKNQFLYAKAYKFMKKRCTSPDTILLCLNDREIQKTAWGHFDRFDQRGPRWELIQSLIKNDLTHDLLKDM